MIGLLLRLGCLMVAGGMSRLTGLATLSGYVHCLVGNNLSELQTLSEDKRCHVLRALSFLAKFAGVYDDFKALKSAYGLKWTGRSSDDLLIHRLTRVTDPEEMFNWIKQVRAAFPLFATFMDFMTATGLRYEEAINSWNLIIEMNVHLRYLKEFFYYQPYGKRELYNREVQTASLEKLAKLIHVTAMLLQTKVYLFWRSVHA